MSVESVQGARPETQGLSLLRRAQRALDAEKAALKAAHEEHEREMRERDTQRLALSLKRILGVEIDPSLLGWTCEGESGIAYYDVDGFRFFDDATSYGERLRGARICEGCGGGASYSFIIYRLSDLARANEHLSPLCKACQRGSANA